MGLGKFDTKVDFASEPDDIEISYWRKHPNLQGWMENLYRLKGGGQEEFNCTSVELTKEDLATLEESIKGSKLPSTQGFFFGSNSDDYYKEQDLTFIEEARKAIDEGKSVYYISWW
jgi:hypothetical protein